MGERTFLALEPGIRDLFLENFAVFPEGLQQQLLCQRELLDRRDPYAVQLRFYEDASGGMLDRMSHADLQTYLVELLMKQDQMSMAASIESRVPFLDHDLVEFVASMPAEWKLAGWTTKRVLRAAARDLLPPSILNRPKMGFPVPFGLWTRGAWHDTVRDVLLDSRTAQRGLTDTPAVRAMLDAVGLEYRVNPRLVRGMDYYNLSVFEFITDSLGAQGTICAGGRYDYLIEQIGGKPAPAVGWALGVERVLELVKERGTPIPTLAPDAYAVVPDAAAMRVLAAADLNEDGRLDLIGASTDTDASAGAGAAATAFASIVSTRGISSSPCAAYASSCSKQSPSEGA